MSAISGAGIHDEYALNIYTDGSSFPAKQRAAGVGAYFLWVDEDGHAQTHGYSPTGWTSATIDEMEIVACTIGLAEADQLFPDMSRFKKIIIFSDSTYVTNNFSYAMNVWPARGWKKTNGTHVENIDLWKRLRKAVYACPVRVEVKWVKAHKANLHNRAADNLAKQSAAKPFNRPLSINQTTRKWSPRKTKRGSIPIQGQEIKIRIIGTEYKRRDKTFEYRYEAIDPASASFQDLDLIRHDQILSRNKCFLVRLNADPKNPRIEEVITELNPDDYNPRLHKKKV
jgi:ribonuclease HI